MIQTPSILWKPSKKSMKRSHMNKFMNWLRRYHHLDFKNYQDLWQWSVDEPEFFWDYIWKYFKIKSHSPYQRILEYKELPDVDWFDGATLNYAEHIFRNKTTEHPALVFQSESQPLTEVSWDELEKKVAALRQFLIESGVKKGDRVVAFLPNIPEATIGLLATMSIGAVWSSCSPDFGTGSVIERFGQIEPTVLLAVDGYQYGGKDYDKMDVVKELTQHIPSLEKVILIPYLDKNQSVKDLPKGILWYDALANKNEPLVFLPVPFEHPMWVLYSSGTTGAPKAITHSHGGSLLEHYKYLALHNDVHTGERFFWFATTGWMMWNFVQASMLVGGVPVLFDGSPGYPDLNVLWRLAEAAPIHHFGTSAPFIMACSNQGLSPKKEFNLKSLRSIGATGSPLPPEGFDYVYKKIKRTVWLTSMSGGTDVCTAFVGGNPLLPVYQGEIQCRALGCALYAYDEDGNPLTNEVGEMVITQPMPSMPVFFWNDPGKKRYRSSYYEMYPGVWRHGDWTIVTDRNSIVIMGRSDATLNRQGVRIGTAEIYRSVDKIMEIKDSLVVNIELEGGGDHMPLFVVMNEGYSLTENVKQAIKKQLRADYSPRHVPNEIIQVPDLPYTISGKKMELPVKKLLKGVSVDKAAKKDAMRNPESLAYFKAL